MFRLLSRWIGLYRKGTLAINQSKDEFPSPREVDRFISLQELQEYAFNVLVSVPSRGR